MKALFGILVALASVCTGSLSSTSRAQGLEGQATASPPTAAVPGGQQSRLQGRAYLGRNRHVVGATVLVRHEEDASRLFLTSSDARGEFRVDGLRDGAYRVDVQREGLTPVAKSDIGLRYPFRAVVELAMESAGSLVPPPQRVAAPSGSGRLTLRGKVQERGGEPLAEVMLRLVRIDGTVDPRRIRTATDGSFGFSDIPAGSWRLEARGVGFLPIRVGLDLGEDTALDVSMVRQPASYDPSPLELMPPEQPIRPPGL